MAKLSAVFSHNESSMIIGGGGRGDESAIVPFYSSSRDQIKAWDQVKCVSGDGAFCENS